MTEITRRVLTVEKEKVMDACFNYCKNHDHSIAIWREPASDNIHLIIDFSEKLIKDPSSIEDMPSGFIFAPFERNKVRYFIQTDIHFDFMAGSTSIKSDYFISGKAEELISFINGYDTQLSGTSFGLNNFESTADDRTQYKNLVSRAIDEIKNGQFQKVVPSRKKVFNINKHLNPSGNFIRLCEAYSNAFVSLIYTPDTGLWMGATPELLIGCNNNHIFKTVALAGTQRFDPQGSINDVGWTQKEIEEQAMVSRYIINCFKKIRLREFDEAGPKTCRAGNLVHLKTEYTVNLKNTNFPQLGSVMLDLLHPTSAICGMPMDPSLNFLIENEMFEREFFSGYLGPVNINNNTSIFVNLRCMKISNGKAILYAGAGVTEDSSPEKEWQETEIKMNTLLNVIQ